MTRVVALACPATEARLLAACIVQPWVLALAVCIGVDDFTEYRHQVAFAALRDLQQTDSVSALAIADHVAMLDADRESCAADRVSPAWIGILLCSTPSYNAAILAERDVLWLRTLANRRRVL